MGESQNAIMIGSVRERFSEAFLRGDRAACVQVAGDALETMGLTVPSLYEEVLVPVFRNAEVCALDDDGCIWREHQRSAVARTVVECCWPFVQRASAQVPDNGLSVLVVCPEKEYHEIGARMVSDFFALLGCRSIFIGANTPRRQIEAAVRIEKPAIVAISVSDYFNLVEAGKVAALVRDIALKGPDAVHTVIAAGGMAFAHNPDAGVKMGADVQLRTFADMGVLVDQLMQKRVNPSNPERVDLLSESLNDPLSPKRPDTLNQSRLDSEIPTQEGGT